MMASAPPRIGVVVACLLAGAACAKAEKSGSPAGEHAGGVAGAPAELAGANRGGAGGKSGSPGAGMSGVAGGLGGTTSGSSGSDATEGGTSNDAGAPGREQGGAGDQSSAQGGAAGENAGGAGAGGSSATGPKPSSLLIMFDASLTMRECADGSTTSSFETDPHCTIGPTRWDVASQAFVEFLQSPASAGLGVALRFFPSDEPIAGCDGYPSTSTGFGFGGMAGSTSMPPGPNCDATACAVPHVELDRLTADAAPADVQEAKLVAAVQGTSPVDLDVNVPNYSAKNPQSPWSAALAGAAQWAESYRASHPDQETGIVLVVDDAPEGCDTSADSMAQVAAAAYAESEVRTYVLGLGSSDATALGKIALAGKTGPLFAPDGADLANDVVAGLSAIRDGGADL
jgi:hypothetical protein